MCNDKNSSEKIPNFIKSPKTAPPSSNAGSATLRPIDDRSMHIETRQIGSASESVSVSFERTDIIQFNTAFFSKRFSI